MIPDDIAEILEEALDCMYGTAHSERAKARAEYARTWLDENSSLPLDDPWELHGPFVDESVWIIRPSDNG